MMKNKKPDIRFKGFSEEWEEKKVAELGEIVTGSTPSTEDKSNYNGNYLFVSPADIQNNRYVENTITTLSEKGFYKGRILKEGSTLFVSIGSTIGKVAQIKEKAVTNQQINSIVPNINYDNDFVLSLLSNRSKYIKGLAATQAVPIINKTSFSNVEIIIPSDKTEQTQIGNFFKNLDNLISLHQRKYEKLGILKKAMLEKMFPKNGADVPEIRFKGFSGAWEEKKLGEVLTEMRRSIILEDSKTYELVTVKRRNQGVVSRGLMKGKDILVKNYFEVREGDYIISKRQVIHGANGIVPKSLDGAIVSNEYLVCVENENITAEYLTIISNLPDMYKKFFLSSYGVDIEKLVFDVEDWKKRSIVIPSLTEQKRITGFFKNLDSLLTLHKGELDKLKNLKKALLEKMFV